MLGKRINEIIIYEFIGHGGAGEVYKAKDEKTNNIYAVKIIKTKNKESEEEFLEETGILKKISHPDVVKIFDYGIFEDYAYIVMELIEYPTLEKYIKKNLSINEITKIILNIARTINYFHNYKPAIIHCDLKPSNIFVYNDFRIKISDFGSAYFIYNNQEFETIKTEIINIITTKEEDKTKISGTYFYTAPEIFLEKNFGFYNDIYSIGVILYQLLTGILPVGFIEMPSKFNPAYFVFDKIIIKSLHNDYKMRYQNLNEFIYDLEQLTKINESKEEYEKEQKKYITADYIPTRIILDLYDSMSIFSKPKEYLVFEEKKIFEDRTKSEKYFEEEKNYYIKEVEELLNKKNYELEKIVELIKKIFLIDENNLFAHTIIENLKREQHKNLYNVLKKIVKIKSNIEIIKRLTKEMEFISSGKTIIGYNYGKSRERPEHIVYVDAFYIDKYLTTIGEYREFKKNYKILKEYDNEKYPVINLNYYEVEEYAEYKNKEIPTEEQWEKAARGKNNYLYAFGNKFNKEFAYVERSINDGLIKIGSYKPNDYGLYDMTGLVWEWTKSKFEPYDKNSNDKKEYNENYKVLKGGCWLSGKDHCRNSFRFYYKPELRTIFTGCRFILTMQKIESIINKSE